MSTNKQTNKWQQGEEEKWDGGGEKIVPTEQATESGSQMEQLTLTHVLASQW